MAASEPGPLKETSSNYWQEEEILLLVDTLLDLSGERGVMGDGMHDSRATFHQVSSVLIDAGHNRTLAQCCRKFRGERAQLFDVMEDWAAPPPQGNIRIPISDGCCVCGGKRAVRAGLNTDGKLNISPPTHITGVFKV